MNNTAEVLKQTDFYEGFSPHEEQPNLYIRVIEKIETDMGLMGAWVYLYNLRLVG